MNLFLRLHIFGDLQERFKAFFPLAFTLSFLPFSLPFPSTPPFPLTTGLGEHREGWNTKFPGSSILGGGVFPVNWERMEPLKGCRAGNGVGCCCLKTEVTGKARPLCPIYFRKLQRATIPGEKQLFSHLDLNSSRVSKVKREGAMPALPNAQRGAEHGKEARGHGEGIFSLKQKDRCKQD